MLIAYLCRVIVLRCSCRCRTFASLVLIATVLIRPGLIVCGLAVLSLPVLVRAGRSIALVVSVSVVAISVSILIAIARLLRPLVTVLRFSSGLRA